MLLGVSACPSSLPRSFCWRKRGRREWRERGGLETEIDGRGEREAEGGGAEGGGGAGGESENERENVRETARDRQTDRERDRQRETETDRHRQRQTERQEREREWDENPTTTLHTAASVQIPNFVPEVLSGSIPQNLSLSFSTLPFSEGNDDLDVSSAVILFFTGIIIMNFARFMVPFWPDSPFGKFRRY